MLLAIKGLLIADLLVDICFFRAAGRQLDALPVAI